MEELDKMDEPNMMLMGLLEIGNSVDGSSIVSKILNEQKDNLDLTSIIAVSFGKMFSWKKRKCHGCMDLILDPGKAITCCNLINEESPCLKVFCQHCVIIDIEQTHNY